MRNVTTPLQARKALASALRAPGRSQVWLAGVLGIGQPAVSGWVLGRYRPGVEYRGDIERLLGIPAAAWATPEEKARAKRVQSQLGATGTEG